MIRKSLLHTWQVALPLLLLSSLSFLSCTSSLDDTPVNNTEELHQVAVTLTGFDFNLVPTRASASDASITHIALKAFNTDGTEAASITQTSAAAGDDFNNLKLQLKAGTYTFVAVAHSATDDNVACATITSDIEATLPEGVVPTLYTHVQEVTIANENNQSVPLEMGQRVNASLQLTSTDIVPDGVAKVAVEINPSGTYVGDKAFAKFNPTTGLFIGNPKYKRALSVIPGQPIDASINILLPEDTKTYPMNVHALDADSKTIADYDRQFDAVPFQRAYITNASGTYFRYVNTSSLGFDITMGNQDFSY